jgi:hypothetical protein
MADSTRAIAEHIRETLKGISKSNYVNTIETVRSFVSHIPYGIPDFDAVDLPMGTGNSPRKRFIYGECALMPEILVLCYGDCDSKSLLMAGILSELIGSQNLALIRCMASDTSNPGGFGPHMMVGVAGLPYKNTTRVSFGSTEYHLIETTAPSPSADAPCMVKDVKVHPLHLQKPQLFPLT